VRTIICPLFVPSSKDSAGDCLPLGNPEPFPLPVTEIVGMKI